MRRLLFAILLGFSLTARAAAPDVAAIVRKLAECAEDPAILAARDAIAYDRESKIDYLNDANEARKRVVRHYLVSSVGGKPVNKLISVNGKPATDKDDEHRSKARESGEKSRSITLSEELLSRYDFRFAGEEALSGRKTWMLRFSPKSGIEADGAFERLLDAMSGILWVDAEEGQLAKAEIYLTRKVSFFGGIAGAIERMDLTFVQKRIEPNLWLGESAFIDFAGRKLFSAMRFRCYETYSGHRRAPSASEMAGAGK